MYLARCAPGIGPQTLSKAARAARTARSTSGSPASAISASGSSVAGLTVAKVRPSAAGTNSPFTNSPYDGAIVTTSRSCGAGAYSQGTVSVMSAWSPQGEVVRPGVDAGELLAALHEQVVQQAGGTDAEQGRGQPF